MLYMSLSLTAQLLLLVPKGEKMKTYKYPMLILAIVVGSEVIFKCLKLVYSMVHHKSSDTVKKSLQTSCVLKRQRTVNKAVFFPDQGILSNLPASKTKYSRQGLVLMYEDPGNQHQGLCGKSHLSEVTTRPFSLNENEVLHSSYLKRSSSLIHLVNALDSAKFSLKVCVYVITLQDLVDAMVRAKNRGVHVRVMVDGQMPNDAALTTLRKNNIAARISHSSQLLHHKFALVDVPDPYSHSVISGNATPTGIHEKSWLGRFSAYLFCRLFSSQNVSAAESAEPLLLTGSFNWTWTAVVNNCENVIISSDLNLISHYNEEFDCLWKNLETS